MWAHINSVYLKLLTLTSTQPKLEAEEIQIQDDDEEAGQGEERLFRDCNKCFEKHAIGRVHIHLNGVFEST